MDEAQDEVNLGEGDQYTIREKLTLLLKTKTPFKATKQAYEQMLIFCMAN